MHGMSAAPCSPLQFGGGPRQRQRHLSVRQTERASGGAGQPIRLESIVVWLWSNKQNVDQPMSTLVKLYFMCLQAESSSNVWFWQQ